MPRLGTKRNRPAELQRKRRKKASAERKRKDRDYWNAKTILELRLGLNMTQKEFAAETRVKYFSAVNRWENGHGRPSLKVIVRLKTLQQRLKRRRKDGMVMTLQEVVDLMDSIKLREPEIAKLVGVARGEPSRWRNGYPPSPKVLIRCCLLRRAINSAATAAARQ